MMRPAPCEEGWNELADNYQTFRKNSKYVTGVPYITANIYYKSRNLPNTDIHNYSTDLR